MADAEQEAARARNEALRLEVDSLLATFEQQKRELADVQERLAATTAEAWSADNLVRVVANVAGVVVEVHLEPEAFKRSTPEKLGRSMAEAAQAAARRAGELSQQALAPIQEVAGDVPDLSDILPGAPSIKDLMNTLLPDPAESAPAQRGSSEPGAFDDEDEDDYYRNRGYLRGER
ncbi:YbaB/EbfC family DNA-binding protein [Nocardia nova]|uniref:YbaB/EbfC family nucleoid-associated protein n=1 Tax=Nocardia nova TaxID=37330 RepID=UPI0025AF8180|nr:YbaB/EbfC family nucleoid-associated protein [Nocardia nova]MDN2501463.1 YbaB/EbfC family DNA-binding protein [Nocardia nova]